MAFKFTHLIKGQFLKRDGIKELSTAIGRYRDNTPENLLAIENNNERTNLLCNKIIKDIERYKYKSSYLTPNGFNEIIENAMLPIFLEIIGGKEKDISEFSRLDKAYLSISCRMLCLDALKTLEILDHGSVDTRLYVNKKGNLEDGFEIYPQSYSEDKKIKDLMFKSKLFCNGYDHDKIRDFFHGKEAVFQVFDVYSQADDLREFYVKILNERSKNSNQHRQL